MTPPTRRNLLAMLAPGMLVAATGVGAGDLATAAFTGNELGLAILWAVLLGAGLKYVLNEGLARWQLATGETLLEGCIRHFGRPMQAIFLVYLLFWSYFVASTLASACGVVTWAMFPVVDDPRTGKIILGIAHSLLGVALVEIGGYRLFERVMGFFIAIMFVTVLVTAVMLRPDWSAVAAGLVWPAIPDWRGQGVSWTIALLGGVGGTVTVLSYGYWIREEGRQGAEYLATCRIDLGVGYALTALFGIAMVIIGSSVSAEGNDAGLVVAMANRLGEQLGGGARWAFLIGGWGAVASSLLGVWQGIPYLFADFCSQAWSRPGTPLSPADLRRSLTYRAYLWALATLPMMGLWYDFKGVQKIYAIVGAAFMPLLAVVLLLLNGRSAWVGRTMRNRPLTTLVLVAALLFFGWAGWLEAQKSWQRLSRPAAVSRPRRNGEAIGAALGAPAHGGPAKTVPLATRPPGLPWA